MFLDLKKTLLPMSSPIPPLPTPLLRITGLSHAFAGAGPLFNQLSADLPAGVNWLTGDESCGKSTVLRWLGGQITVQQGRCEWLHPAGPLQPADVAWHDPASTALDQQSPREFLAALPPSAERQARIGELIDGLSLVEHLDKPLFKLSTGGRRKALMAASLARGARLTLLDQPFSSLDRPSIEFLLAQLQQVQENTDRIWLMADYVAPPGVQLASTWHL